MTFDGFEAIDVQAQETSIFLRRYGSGPPLLLLHGFPETHLMWRGVAPLLARDFTVVCADLRGYGRSGCPVSDPDHAPYFKRIMARGMVAVMSDLAFRASPSSAMTAAVESPTGWPLTIRAESIGLQFSTSCRQKPCGSELTHGSHWFWPWSLLAQPEPLPERILVSAAEAIVENALSRWGTPSTVFPAVVRAAYVRALQDFVHAHAICEEYRAAATIDREHDRADRVSGRRIACPLLALWSARGALNSWYTENSGPIGLWQAWGDDVEGQSLDAGHFFPEEAPRPTADMLKHFLQRQ
jgi:haloacetate dehalogenase